MPFTVAAMTRQIFFDEAATTPDSLAPEGIVNLTKLASAFNVAAFFVLTVGATRTAMVFVFVDDVTVVEVVVVVGTVHALSHAVNLVSNSFAVMPKVVANAAAWSPDFPASTK